QGTSIGCVQCHGHPYDPFVHREYYQLLAFLDNTADADREDEAPTRRFYSRANVSLASLLEQRIAANQPQLDGELKGTENREACESWLREVRPEGNFLPLKDQTVTSTQGNYRVQKDGAVRLEGEAPTETTITVEGKPESGRCRALVLAALPDPSLPQGGPGASSSGDFIVTYVHAELGSAGAQPSAPLEFCGARPTL